VVQIGAITAMVSYSNRFWGPLQHIGIIYNHLMDAMSYLERIFQVLDEPVTVETRRRPSTCRKYAATSPSKT
jgi:ATP-binding cassette subfamily B protein